MNKIILKASFLSIATALVLGTAGCSGGGSSSGSDGGDSGGGGGNVTSTTSSGAAAKGPFKEGSSVIAYKLINGVRDVSTGTTTTDGKGSFSFGTTISWTGPTEYVISGEYLNENTGTYMVLPAAKGLSAVTNIVSGTDESININILTNIAASGIKVSLANSIPIETAKAEAQANVAALFNLDLGGDVELTDLDLTDATENIEANTQLLILSAALLSTDNPEQVMEQLAEDMADGSVDDSALAALDELKAEAADVDLQEVATIMEEANIGVTDAPDAESALNGTLSFNHTMSFTSSLDGFTNTAYTSDELTVNGIIGESGVISIVNGTYSIDGGAFVSSAGAIANGQKVKVKTTSSANYSTDVEAKLTIGGGVIAYNVITEDDPFIADTNPNDFSFAYLVDQTKNSLIESAPVTITGVNTATPISITDGEYEINNSDTWITADGTIDNNDIVTLRHTTSLDGGSQAVSTLTIGEKTTKFSTFTLVDDTTPDVFTFSDANDVNKTDTPTVDSNTITIDGINIATDISIVGGEMSIDGGGFTTTATTITNAQTLQLRAIPSDNYETTTEVSVTVGNVVSTFNITTMSDPFVADTTPNTFSFDTVLNQAVDADIIASVTVSGINTGTPVSITNGTFGIGTPGILTEGTVSNGDDIVVTNTTSSDFDTENVTTLTIGGVSGNFKTRTLLEDTTPDSVDFTTNEGIAVDTLATSNTVTIGDINSEIPISITNGEYEINGGGYTSVEGVVSDTDTVTIQQTSASTQGTSNVTTVTIGSMTRSFTTVTIKNPPVISGTPVTAVDEDTTYSFTPDTDTTSGEIESWSISNQPSWATFNTVNGLLSGTPTNDDVGTDANIVITATNSEGNTDLAAFDIVVGNTNDAPTAQDTNVTTNEDTPNTIDTTALVADIDVGDTYTLTVTQPANGDVVVDGTNLVYTPSANFFGTNSFTYTAKDSGNATVTATVNVTVNAVNDSMTWTAPTIGAQDEDFGAFDTDIAGSDVDGGITYSITSTNTLFTPSLSGATLTLTAVENANGSEVLTLQATEGGETRTEDVTITVNAGNDAPTASESNISVVMNNLYTGTLNGDDIDSGDTLTFSIVDDADANGTVTITDAAAGTFTYDPVTDFEGSALFTYKVTDSSSADSSTATVNITVADRTITVNAADDTAGTNEDESVTITVLDNDVSIFDDDGSTATGTIVSAVGVASNGTVSIDGNTIIYTPEANFNGTDSFEYTANTSGYEDIATVSVTITEVNDSPVIATISDVVVDEDSGVATVPFSVTDVDSTPVLSVTSSDSSVVIVDINETDISITPQANANGAVTITVSADDVDETFMFTVTAVDDAPTIATVDDITVSLAGDQSVTLNITDIDGTGIVVTSTDGNDSAATTVVSGGDTLTITPVAAGSSLVTIRAAKDTNASVYSEQTFTVTVSEANQAPTASDSFMTLQSGETMYGTLNFSDPENDALTFTIDTAPSNGTAEIINGVLKYSANTDYDGSDSVSFTVDDGEYTASATVSITVQPLLLRDTLENETPLDTAGFEALSESTFLEDTMLYEVDIDWNDGVISVEGESFEFNSSDPATLYWYEADENGSTTYHMDGNIAVIENEDDPNIDEEKVKYLGPVTATEIRTDLNITMPDSAEGYRIAWLRVAEEYEFWGEVVSQWDDDTSSEITFDSLENFIANGTYVDWRDNGSSLIFADGQTTSDTSGTIVQITNDSQAVIEADAGTWDIVSTASNGDVLVIHASVDSINEEGCSEAYTYDDTLLKVVYGEYCEAGYGAEFRVYNDVAQAVILNAFKLADMDNFDTDIADTNGAAFNGFDGLLAEPLVIDVDMYGVDSWQEGNGSMVINEWIERFNSDGSFTFSEDGETENYQYTESADIASIGDGTDYFYEVKLIEVLDANELSSTFLFAEFGADDIGYKMAFIALNDEFDYWEDASIYHTGGDPVATAESLAEFISNAQLGTSDTNDQNGFAWCTEPANKLLAFADGSTGTSGTLSERDEDLVTNVNAGTWEIVNDVLYIHPNVEGFNDNIIFSMDEQLVVQRGEFEAADTGEIEYKFNLAARDSLVQGINDNNISFDADTDLDRDGLIATISPEVVQPMYWYGGYRNDNHMTIVEYDEFLYDGSGSLTINFSEDGVVTTENLGYTMAGLTAIIDDNEATPTNIHKIKILGVKNALGIEAMSGIEMPEAARAYEVAHLRLIDEFDFWGEEAVDIEGSTFDTIEYLVTTANESNSNIFIRSYDWNYGLQFASGDTCEEAPCFGTIMEHDIDNDTSTAVGQWKTVQDGSDDVIVFSVSGTSGEYSDDNALKDTGNVEIGEYEAAYTGDVSYQFNSVAKEILDVYFQNSRDIRMGFTQAELNGSTYYTIKRDLAGNKYAARLIFADATRTFEAYSSATIGGYEGSEVKTADYDVNTQGVLHVDLSASGTQLYVHVMTRDESKITSQGYNGNELTDTRWFFINEQEAIDFYNSLP